MNAETPSDKNDLPMLTRAKIRNYRCLEEVDVPLDRLTAFVGPNGTGKTTILRAVDLVLGETWPSLRSFRIPQDFTNFDSSRELEITVYFHPPYIHRDALSKDYEVSSLRLSCKPYKKSGKWGEAGDLHVDLEPLDAQESVPTVAITRPQKGQKPQFQPLRVGTELRDHARILFIDHRRSLAQHLPSVRGSILGRLLQQARKEFSKEGQEDFRQAYEQAMDLLRTSQVKQIEDTIRDTAKRMLGFLGRGIAEEVDISFGFADPANPFNSLRLQYREANLDIQGEELGLGIQSAVVVGIFEAFRQLGGKFGIVVIEEPEMYLHPQAQRYFYKLLCEMADKGQCQVIYSTHSPIFADVNRFESLRLVRREHGRTTITFVEETQRDALRDARAKFKIGNRFESARNEILFARRVLLCEGYGDRIALLTVAEKLGFDPDAEGCAIVECGGKNEIRLFVLVCQALRIPFSAVHDEDVRPTDGLPADQKDKQEQENRKAQSINEELRKLVGNSGRLFVIAPSLEDALGISRSASDKPQKIFERIQEYDPANLPENLMPLKQALDWLRGEEPASV